MFDIFNHPWDLITAAVVLVPVIFIVRIFLPQKHRLWPLALPPLIALAGLGLDYYVKTDLEKIKDLIHTGSEAVEQENPDAIDPIIAPDYRDSYHLTKNILMIFCRTTLSKPLVEKNIIRNIEVTFSPEKTSATAIFTARIVFDKQSRAAEYKQLILTKVKLALRKQPNNQWLINCAEILELNMQPAKWKDIRQADW